ncbi:hypothetical protein AB6D63_20350, partial [Vibrio splendidus]
MKTSIKQTILTASLFVFTQHSSIAAELKVKGLNKTLTENVELYLEALADVPASQWLCCVIKLEIEPTHFACF